jgi:hypothetical protein
MENLKNKKDEFLAMTITFYGVQLNDACAVIGGGGRPKTCVKPCIRCVRRFAAPAF